MTSRQQRDFDGDAKFTFILSLLFGLATFGLSHLFIFLRVRTQALNCSHIVDNISAIAVPGHALQNGKVSKDYQLRLEQAAQLFWMSGNVPIRVLGGCPQNEISEAQAGHDYLSNFGVPASSISTEEVSTNTLENMRQSRDWFSNFDEVVLVTNRYHVERLQTLADGLGLKVKVCAAEEEARLQYRKLLAESFFLHWYWTGRLYATFMKNQRMLDKIS